MQTISADLNTALQQSGIYTKPKVIMQLSNNKAYSPTLTCDNTVNTVAMVDGYYEPSMKLAVTDSFYTTDDWARMWPTDIVGNQTPWISTATSQSNGTFSSPVTVEVTYPTDVYCNKILVTTEPNYFKATSIDVWVNFAGSYYKIITALNPNSYKTEIYLQAPGGNSWSATVNRDYLTRIKGVKVAINSIQNAGKAQIYEIDAQIEKDISDDVLTWRITKERDLSSSQVSPVGVSSANSAAISLANDDNKYNGAYTLSPYYSLMVPGVRFDISWGFRVNATDYEYVPQGIFYADSFSVSSDTSIVEVACRDNSFRLQDNLTPGLLYKDVLIQDIVRDIVERVGIKNYSIDVSVLTNEDLTPGHEGEIIDIDQLVCVPLHMNVWSTDEESYWDFLQSISVADLGVFYFDESGNFVFKVKESLTNWTLQGNQTAMMISGSDRIIDAAYNTELLKNDYKLHYSIPKPSRGTVSLWDADVMTLDAIHLDGSIGATDKTINVVTSTSDDLLDWQKEGYIKINDEIIKYRGREKTKFLSCERAQKNTTAAFHANDSVAYEIRKIEAEYMVGPAVKIFYWLTNGAYVEIIDLEIGPMKSIIWVLNKNDGVSMVSGNNPDIGLEGLNEYFQLAGKVLERKEEQTLDRTNQESIAKYGKRSFEISLDWVQSEPHARTLLEYLDAVYSRPVVFINSGVFAIPHLQIGDVVVMDWSRLGFYDTQFHVVGINIEASSGGVSQSLTLRSRAGVV